MMQENDGLTAQKQPPKNASTMKEKDPVAIRDRELFDRIAHEYAQKDIVPSTREIRRFDLISSLDLILGKDYKVDFLVEVACGPAAPIKYLKGRYTHYLGIDQSAKLVEFARQFHKDEKNVNFLVSDIMDVQKLDRPADLVLVVGALHHMTDLDAVMCSLIRIAKPGAYIVSIEPQGANPVIQLIRYIRGKIDSSYSAEQKFFQASELVDLYNRHNLEDVEFVYKGFLSRPFGEIILKPIWLFSVFGNILIAMDKLLNRFLPRSLGFLSWGLVIRGRVPKDVQR